MTPLELAQFVISEARVRKEWLDQAKRMREDANMVEKLDVTLATMLRRQALAIEQYQQRLLACAVIAEVLSCNDSVSEEDEEMIQDLLSRTLGVSR